MEENGKLFIILHHPISIDMSGFFGKYNAKLDDKGRLVIPSAIKNAVPSDQMEFVIRKDMYSNCLEMYTRQEWAAMSQAVRSKLDLAFDEDHMRYWRTYMSDTITVGRNRQRSHFPGRRLQSRNLGQGGIGRRMPHSRGIPFYGKEACRKDLKTGG